jgi:hypothetical protein
MSMKKLVAACFVTTTMAALLLAKSDEQKPSGTEMTQAAGAFLESLTDQQKQRATFAYDDEERLNWHFIPRERKGLPLKDLDGEAFQAAHRFIASGLSESGYDQTIQVMSLEEVLFLLEGGDREARRARRDPQNYYISIFGTPTTNGLWGWRLEGHHLSLNFSIENGNVVASTPEFFGANPGSIDAGPGRRIRVLGAEEDLGRQVLKLCSPEQREVVWIDKEAPGDLRGGGVTHPEQTEPVGLPISKMSNDQKQMMSELLSEYLKNMPRDVERDRRQRLNEAGLENIYFAWWGGSELNEPHYYRVQGPTFLIEYNNTQNSANHVHSMWRNMAGDFNLKVE